MTLTARYNVMVNGHIYAKGDKLVVADDAELPERIKANFILADAPRKATVEASADDGGDTETEPEKRTMQAYGRDGILRELDALHIPYSPKAATAKLAKLLLQAKGEQ